MADLIKADRLNRLNAVVNRVAEERAQRFLGRDLEILVEGPNPRNPDQVRPHASQQGCGREQHEGRYSGGKHAAAAAAAAAAATLGDHQPPLHPTRVPPPPLQAVGRTQHNKLLYFDGDGAALKGTLAMCHVDRVHAYTLYGTMV